MKISAFENFYFWNFSVLKISSFETLYPFSPNLLLGPFPPYWFAQEAATTAPAKGVAADKEATSGGVEEETRDENGGVEEETRDENGGALFLCGGAASGLATAVARSGDSPPPPARAGENVGPCLHADGGGGCGDGDDSATAPAETQQQEHTEAQGLNPDARGSDVRMPIESMSLFL